MIDMQPMNESALAREYLRRLCEDKSILHRAAFALDRIARSSVGLGEVLQDYASQASRQLHDVLRVAASVVKGDKTQEGDSQILSDIHFALKIVKSVLEMTPAAMRRNKAEAIGDKDKLSGADITEITDGFLRSADVARLLATEDSGLVFAALINGEETGKTRIAPEKELLSATASH